MPGESGFVQLMYAVGWGYDSSALYRIDKYATAPVAVNIGDTGVPLVDIAISPIDGKAYGLGFDRNLYSLDLQTGAASQVGATGLGTIPTSLEFDAQGTLFMMGFTNPHLYTVNVQTGQATRLLTTGFGARATRIRSEWEPVRSTTNDELAQINLMTARADHRFHRCDAYPGLRWMPRPTLWGEGPRSETPPSSTY
jgi:hypothetical protein